MKVSKNIQKNKEKYNISLLNSMLDFVNKTQKMIISAGLALNP
jgi:hypothetical protein